jgi:hypothetical protein
MVQRGSQPLTVLVLPPLLELSSQPFRVDQVFSDQVVQLWRHPCLTVDDDVLLRQKYITMVTGQAVQSFLFATYKSPVHPFAARVIISYTFVV